MAVVLLLDPNEFKERSNVHDNLDDKFLYTAIEDCQSMFVEYIIGTGLLNELIDQVENSTLTALNTTLLNTYLQPAMRHWVTAELVKPTTYRMMAIGAQTKDSENSQPVSDDRLQNIEDYYRNRAEHYAKRTYEYLCENSTSYPLFDDPGDGIDVVIPKRRQYTTGIYMPRKGREDYGLPRFSDRKNYSEDW